MCKDDDAEEPLLTPGSRTSTSSDGSYRDEQARIDGHGPRGRRSGRRPRRPSASERAAHCSRALLDASTCYSCHYCGAHVRACRSFHPYVFASYLKSAIPVVDDYVRSLKSFRNEMELCEGAVQDRAADADTAGSARCHETGERGRSPPGADTKREGEAAEDSDSEPPFLRSRRRLRRGRSSARGGAAVS